MDLPSPPCDIRERTIQYSLRVKVLSRFLMDRGKRDDREIADQILRSALSIGANLHEATAAESRSDFIHKNQLAFKEAKECLYWLRILKDSGTITLERIAPLFGETEQICKILGSITSKLKRSRGSTSKSREIRNRILPDDEREGRPK